MKYRHKKHFTVDEARRDLIEVHALAVRMTELKEALDQKGWDVSRHEYFGGMGPNGDGTFPPEMEWLVNILKNLDTRGILVKGLDKGLLDFPHVRANGEEVYLCWRVGEDDIRYWHRIEDGYAGRASIDDL
jgi:hypothetical protein